MGLMKKIHTDMLLKKAGRYYTFSELAKKSELDIRTEKTTEAKKDKQDVSNETTTLY